MIFLHCPLFPETEGIINKENIAKMKDGVIIINNSRGQLVVEEDLKMHSTVEKYMRQDLMLFLLSRLKKIIHFFRQRTVLLHHISHGQHRQQDRELWILRLIISRLFWLVIQLTELINKYFSMFRFPMYDV